MAALTFLVCSSIQQLYDLTGYLVLTGFSVRKSFRYLQAKHRLILFHQHCRALWQLNDSINASERYLKESQTRDIFPISGARMQRDIIDFAAIEASVEASEAIHTYASKRGKRPSEGSFGARNFEFVEENYDDIEVISGLEIDTSYYEYLDSLPLYYNSQLGILTEGVSFTVTGYILLNCERFSINFILDNATKDVALHINPRLPQSYIVRNTKVKNVWGREEVSSALPFSLRRGSKFAIQVLITNNSFLISVNGYHFAEYYHRVPFSLIGILEVKGDVDNVNVDRSEVAHYPDRLPEAEAKDIRIAIDRESMVGTNDDSGMDESPDEIDGTHIPREWRLIPTRSKLQDSPSLHSDMRFTLPYYGQLPAKSLLPGRVLKVEGRVKLLPHSFYINLQRGHHFWPHATIAFHFNPRFSKQSGAIGKAIVCRNAWVDGQWADEERSELDTDFRPGKTFSLAIVCGKQAFEVYVNRKRIVDYTYRVSPEIVDTVYIQGDIKLWDVVLENNDAFSRQSRIYQNPAYTEDY